MDLRVEKGFSMKVFHSFLTILLVLFCIIYLLFYPQQDYTILHGFSSEALAAESGHNTLSEALSLSMKTTYQEHISAHDKRYYCIPFQEDAVFEITSTSIHSLKAVLLSETGKRISCNTHKTKKTKTVIPSSNSTKNSKRIFLCLMNQSTSPCSLKIQVFYYPNSDKKTTKPKTKKVQATASQKPANPNTVTLPNSKIRQNKSSSTPLPKINQSNFFSTPLPKINNQTTSNPVQNDKKKKNLSTIRAKSITLYPQFIKINPDSVKKLSVPSDKKVSDFIWLSSNPLIATITNGKVHAIKEGVTIIYIHQKNHPEISSSCFVRVIERK